MALLSCTTEGLDYIRVSWAGTVKSTALNGQERTRATLRLLGEVRAPEEGLEPAQDSSSARSRLGASEIAVEPRLKLGSQR